MSSDPSNVTLAKPHVAYENAHIRCFLCELNLEIRQDKNGKPYFICDQCGIQTFIRKQSGIKEFTRFLDETAAISRNSLQLAELTGLREQLEIQLEEIKNRQGLAVIFNSTEEDPAILALEKQIAEIEIKISGIQRNQSIKG